MSSIGTSNLRSKGGSRVGALLWERVVVISGMESRVGE